MLRIKVPTQPLRPYQCHQDRVGIDTPHEDTDDLAVLIALGAVFHGREREARADRRLDGGTGRGDEVAQLVGGADDEGADGPRRELHQMDGDHTPGTLYHELLEEGGGHDGFIVDEGVGVEQGAADDADHDDGEAAAEDLTRPAAEGAAAEGTEVGDDLRDGHGGLGELELVLEHCRVEIL